MDELRRNLASARGTILFFTFWGILPDEDLVIGRDTRKRAPARAVSPS